MPRARTWRLLATHPAFSLHDPLEVAPDDITQLDAWVREAHVPGNDDGAARSRRGVHRTFMRHVDYCVEMVGIGGVTFGPDTFFGDHAGSYALPSGALLASGDSEYDAVVPEYVVGLENIGDFPNIVRWLVKHGYADDEIAKVIGGNTLRVPDQARSA